jgi:1-acyl-sn-glycerol-3-phosphate acyltransferase
VIPGLGTLAAALGAAQRRLQGDYEEDEWGFDPGFATAAQPALDFFYDRWWRVTATGTEHVPAAGRALIVANHAGVVPWDATMMTTALLRAGRRSGAERHPRFLVLNWAFELPWASVAIRRYGGVPASSANALALLRQDRAVMVFPEGAKGTGKAWKERYRLERFGRGGFVEIALRSGAPIVPCAVVGSEEIYPKLAEAPLLARLVGAPYIPITPTFPLLGLLGAVPLPSRWRIEFCPPVDLSAYGPDAADDRALVLELSDAIREQIQQKVYENLIRREGAFS